jgi:hypothetical protein
VTREPFWRRWEQWRADYYTADLARHGHRFDNWRTRRRCRQVAAVVTVLIVAAGAASIGVIWWFGFLVLWLVLVFAAIAGTVCLRYMTGGGADGPQLVLDERQLARRNAARSLGLTISIPLLVLPYGILIGSVIKAEDGLVPYQIVYSAAILIWWVLCVARAAPSVLYAWWQEDPDLEDSVDALFDDTHVPDLNEGNP